METGSRIGRQFFVEVPNAAVEMNGSREITLHSSLLLEVTCYEFGVC